MSLQELHERLLSWASAAPRDQDLLEAKRAHFERHGEPHEEDRFYELRLNGMLDAYLYDYRPGGGFKTTLERFVEEAGPALPPAEVEAYRALGQSVHGLFEVRKIRDGGCGFVLPTRVDQVSLWVSDGEAGLRQDEARSLTGVPCDAAGFAAGATSTSESPPRDPVRFTLGHTVARSRPRAAVADLRPREVLPFGGTDTVPGLLLDPPWH